MYLFSVYVCLSRVKPSQFDIFLNNSIICLLYYKFKLNAQQKIKNKLLKVYVFKYKHKNNSKTTNSSFSNKLIDFIQHKFNSYMITLFN